MSGKFDKAKSLFRNAADRLEKAGKFAGNRLEATATFAADRIEKGAKQVGKAGKEAAGRIKDEAGNIGKKLKKKKKSPPMFAVPMYSPSPDVLADFLFDSMEHILQQRVEGIFRKSGSMKNVEELKKKLDKGIMFDISKQKIHDVTSLLKLYFRELPGSLIPTEFQDPALNACQVENEEDRNIQITKILHEIPPHLAILLKHMICMLHLLSGEEIVATTKMGPSNFSLIFNMVIIHPPEKEDPTSTKIDPAEMKAIMLLSQRSQALVIILIENYETIFESLYPKQRPKELFKEELFKIREEMGLNDDEEEEEEEVEEIVESLPVPTKSLPSLPPLPKSPMPTSPVTGFKSPTMSLPPRVTRALPQRVPSPVAGDEKNNPFQKQSFSPSGRNIKHVRQTTVAKPLRPIPNRNLPTRKFVQEEETEVVGIAITSEDTEIAELKVVESVKKRRKSDVPPQIPRRDRSRSIAQVEVSTAPVIPRRKPSFNLSDTSSGGGSIASKITQQRSTIAGRPSKPMNIPGRAGRGKPFVRGRPKPSGRPMSGRPKPGGLKPNFPARPLSSRAIPSKTSGRPAPSIPTRGVGGGGRGISAVNKHPSPLGRPKPGDRKPLFGRVNKIVRPGPPGGGVRRTRSYTPTGPNKPTIIPKKKKNTIEM